MLDSSGGRNLLPGQEYHGQWQLYQVGGESDLLSASLPSMGDLAKFGGSSQLAIPSAADRCCVLWLPPSHLAPHQMQDPSRPTADVAEWLDQRLK